MFDIGLFYIGVYRWRKTIFDYHAFAPGVFLSPTRTLRGPESLTEPVSDFVPISSNILGGTLKPLSNHQLYILFYS